MVKKSFVNKLLLFLFFISCISSKENELPKTSYEDLNKAKHDLSKILDGYTEMELYYIHPTCDGCKLISQYFKNKPRKGLKRIVVSFYLEHVNYNEFSKSLKLHDEDMFLIDKENSFPDDFNLGQNIDVPLILRFKKTF